MMFIFFCFGKETTILEKLILHYQICYKFWFMLFNLSVANDFFFGNLNKIPALQNLLLVNHIEWDKNVNTVSYLKWLTCDVTWVIFQQWLTDLKPVAFLIFYRKKRLHKYHNKLLKNGHLAQLLLQVWKIGPKRVITKPKVILKLNF